MRGAGAKTRKTLLKTGRILTGESQKIRAFYGRRTGTLIFLRTVFQPLYLLLREARHFGNKIPVRILLKHT